MVDVRADAVAVIPAHDEAETVSRVVRAAGRHLSRVVVVDDGSSDATGDLAAAAGAEVIRLVPNRGKGAALRVGIAHAVATGATRIVTLDADGEHDPEAIPSFLAALDGADLVLGWRDTYRSGARRVANALALFWFRLLDPAIRDTICGYRAFRSTAVDVLQNDATGFAFEHEVVLRAVAARLRLASIRIDTVPRTRSHVTPREILRANNHFDRWVLRNLRALPLPLWRRALLAVGTAGGLALGAPVERWLARGGTPR